MRWRYFLYIEGRWKNQGIEEIEDTLVKKGYDTHAKLVICMECIRHISKESSVIYLRDYFIIEFVAFAILEFPIAA